MEKIRISKYLSEQGIMSRRTADEEISAGRVTVNGRKAVLGEKIDPDSDVILYKGKPTGGEVRKICIMLNKPRGYVTTMEDERGRKCVADLVSDVGMRVYPIGRLDRDSEGLLLLTNDGELANMLTHPKYHKPKVYNVKVRGTVDEKTLERLRRPFNMDGYITKPAEVKRLGETDGITSLSIKLFEGRNRQIRKMCDKCLLEVTELRRVSIGEIKLGELQTGKWRMLDRAQVDKLKEVK